MTLWSGGVLVVAVFLTATFSGVYGMVGGMMLLWVLLLLMPVSAAIAVQGILQLVANISRAWFARHYMNWRIIGFSVVGLGLAVLVLSAIRYTPNLAAVSICIGLLPVFAWMPVRWIHLDASRPGHAFLCGFSSGLLNIGTGVAGPIVDIFFVRTEMDRRAVIATKAMLVGCSHVAKIAFYSGALVGMDSTTQAAVLIAAPFSVLGSMAGHRILVRLTDQGFRRATRWLVTIVGVFFLTQGIWLLATGG